MPGHATNLRIQSPWCRASKILPLLHAVIFSFAGAATAQETCHGVSDVAFCQALHVQDPDFCTTTNAEINCKVLCGLCPATLAPSFSAPTTSPSTSEPTLAPTPSPTGSPTCADAAGAVCLSLVLSGCGNPNIAIQCRGSCNNCLTESPTEGPTSPPITVGPSASPTLMPTTSTPTTLVPTMPPTASTTTELPTLSTLPTVTTTLPPTDDVGEVNQVAGASSGDSAGVAADVVVGIIVAAIILLVLGIAIGRWQRSTQQPGQQHNPQLVWRTQSRGDGAKGGVRQGSSARGIGGRMATVENDKVGQGISIESAGYIDIAEGPAFGFDSPAPRQSTGSVDLEIFALGQSTSADPHGGTDQDQNPGFNLWT